jgi:group I intron endonuclease
MKAYIYKISSNKTEEFYVGSTIQELKNRFKTHKSNARLGKDEKLYKCMREYSIENFVIELVEEFDIQSKGDVKIGKKEVEHFIRLKPTLNMVTPKIREVKEFGRIYRITYQNDNTLFYIGSTEKKLSDRLSTHKSASNRGKTPFYQFMKEKGKDNFAIECIEDNIPTIELITRENYWISQLKPSLNKNTNLCITEKERDRLKYLKNREKRLKQVNDRLLVKREEINAQKRVHYQANKERIAEVDKQKRKELREKEIEPYIQSPNFIKDILIKHTVFELKEIAKRFGMKVSPKIKESLIEKILEKQKDIFE